MANELADLLEKRGRVRVALAREGDAYLTLDQRAAIARRIGASLFVSLHMDSAPNPLARGATLYSLSDVASSEEAARFASAENRAGGALSSEADGSLRSILVRPRAARADGAIGRACPAHRSPRRGAGRAAPAPAPVRRLPGPAPRRHPGACWSRRAISATSTTRRCSPRRRAAPRSSWSWRRRSRPISRLVDCADRALFRRADHRR